MRTGSQFTLLFVGILLIAIIPPLTVLTVLSDVFTTKSNGHVNKDAFVPQAELVRRSFLFYIVDLPEVTAWLVGNFSDQALAFYRDTLNEEQAEVWIHRCFDVDCVGARTLDPHLADVFLIPGYLHFNYHLIQKKIKKADSPLPYEVAQLAELVISRLVNTSKPHYLLVPTWNPGVAINVGISHLMNALRRNNVNIYSVGFERNPLWQKIPAGRILPIPYVVMPHLSQQEVADAMASSRQRNFVFYVGDVRGNAVSWAGCHRSMVLPLEHRQDMYIRLIAQKQKRLSQAEYNRYLLTADYCLILCGDTPTSRSLASAMVHGCIPLQVGSRLHGKCEPPCRAGWGWEVVDHIEYAHLPFADKINWSIFPQVNEANFSKDPVEVLQELFARVLESEKATIRASMALHQQAWIFGWGSPITSTEFGGCVPYIWDSLKRLLESRTI